jgi:hypothetical protein
MVLVLDGLAVRQASLAEEKGVGFFLAVSLSSSIGIFSARPLAGNAPRWAHKKEFLVKNTRRIVGQIILAVGITWAIGGVASFMFEKVELRFLGNSITSETGRIIWIITSALLACVGFYLWRSSKAKDSAL